MAEQAQALKAEAPVGRDVCLVSKGYGKSLCLSIAFFFLARSDTTCTKLIIKSKVITCRAKQKQKSKTISS